MKKLLKLALLLLPITVLAQAPQIPLTGNIGSGFNGPLINSPSVIFTSDADHTMVYPEMSGSGGTIIVTSTPSLTSTRNLLAPNTGIFNWVVRNNTTGGQSINVKVAGGTGVSIANGNSSVVMCDTINCYVPGGQNVTQFLAPSASWPSWLVPTVTNQYTTPSLAVAASAATSSTDGYLSASDWSTFNGKQNALTNPVTGTGSGGTTNDLACVGNSSVTSMTDCGIAKTNVLTTSSSVFNGVTYPSSYSQYALLTAPTTTSVSSLLPSSWTSGHYYIPIYQALGSPLAPSIVDLGTYLGANLTASLPIVATLTTAGVAFSCPTCGSSSGGTNVSVNGGSSLGNLNINATAPMADTSFLALTPKISGSNMIVEAPYATSSQYGVTLVGASGGADAYGAAAARQANLSLVAGTYANGDMCTYASSGTLLNCNTAIPSLSGALLATGATTGATSQIQQFTMGIGGPYTSQLIADDGSGGWNFQINTAASFGYRWFQGPSFGTLLMHLTPTTGILSTLGGFSGAVNGVSLSNAGAATLYLDKTGNYSTPAGTYSLPSTVVQTNQANTYSTGLQDFSSATMKLPSSVTQGGYTTTFPAATGTLAIGGGCAANQYMYGNNLTTACSQVDYSQLTGTPTIGTWGALNYPSWASGTPFVKMTAAGTFALDTNTYLTSLSGALLATGATTGATSQVQSFTNGEILGGCTTESIWCARVASDINMYLTNGADDSTAAEFEPLNNGVSALIPFEFRASKFYFMGGNVSIGKASAPSLFSVGSSAQFQVNSSGVSSAGAGSTDYSTVTSAQSAHCLAAGDGNCVTLGGALSCSNVVMQSAAGSGAICVAVSGTDATHVITFETGATPGVSDALLILNFTASRGHTSYCVAGPEFNQYLSLGQIPYIGFGFSTSYTLKANGVALSGSTEYSLNVFCP